MVTCGVATILVNRRVRSSKKKYDKSMARTSKLCYDSLASERTEKQIVKMNWRWRKEM